MGKKLVNVDRQVFNDIELQDKYPKDKPLSENILKSGINHISKHYKPSGSCCKNFILDRFPLFRWILAYDFRQNTLPDFISGFTIGIVHIPQSLAYTSLALLPPYIGLYVSIFPVILYVLFGTSRHLSMGTFAIPAIMTASVLMRYEGILYPSESGLAKSLNDTSQYLSTDINVAKIKIGMILAFMVGILQVIFAVLHIGFVTKYLSDSIVAGFTTGAAIHIVTSQIASLLGYKAKKSKLMFKLIGNYIEIFKGIHKTTLASCIVSVISIIILYLVKEQINHRFEKKMFMPVPIELMIVAGGTALSYFFEFNKKFGIEIVAYIPKGLPPPELPPFHLISKLFGDAISIAIVTFAMNISMAKFFAKKYKYDISPNQELFSYGTGNILSSFFQGYPSCVSLSRCAILEATNAKTQAYSIISTILVILICLFIGPLFETLPIPCLAAIIVVALKGMVLQILQVPSVYRVSKMEALGWIVTFLGVMILDVDIGLYIGIGWSLVMIIFRTQRAKMSVLGNLPGTEMYESYEICEKAETIPGIKILRYEESLYYANVEYFKYQMYKKIGLKPEDVLAKAKKGGLRGYENGGFDGLNVNQSTLHRNDLDLEAVILDMSSINFIDSNGVDALCQIKDAYQSINIQFYFANYKIGVLKMLKKKAFSSKFDFTKFYPTVHDAVCSIKNIQMRKSFEIVTQPKLELEYQPNNYIEEDLDDEFSNDLALYRF